MTANNAFFDPQLPSLPPVRLAPTVDQEFIDGMAGLSLQAFIKDNRPKMKQPPPLDMEPALNREATSWYSQEHLRYLRMPSAAVVVVEGMPTFKKIKIRYGEPQAPDEDDIAPSKPMVAAFGIFVMPEGSPRYNQFGNIGAYKIRPLEDTLERFLPRTGQQYNLLVENVYEKHMKDKIFLHKMLVHPAHRSRGHELSIIQWGLRMADQDGVDLCTISARTSNVAPFIPFPYESFSLGFQKVEEIQVPDTAEFEGYTAEVLVYKAKKEVEMADEEL